MVFGPRTSNVGKGLAKAARGDVVILGAMCGSVWIARDPLFRFLGVWGPFCFVFGRRTSNVGKGLAKATREDVVIFGAVCGNIRTARDPLSRLLGV